MDEKTIKEKIKLAHKIVEGESEPYKIEAFKIILETLVRNPSTIKQVEASLTSPPKKPKKEASTKKGPKYHLEELINEGFFAELKNMKNILDELKNRTFHYKAQGLTLQLRSLVREKMLHRVEQKNDEGKTVLHWSNW